MLVPLLSIMIRVKTNSQQIGRGNRPLSILLMISGFGVASFTAELCYSLNQEPKYTPKEDNPAHCDIIGRKTQSVTKKFRDCVKYLLYPGDKLDS